jgi:large subunit ribosomal protein L2
MALKIYRPTSPGVRHRVRLTWDTEGGDLTVPKFLSEGKRNTGGRNNRGRITSFHRGGGHKRLFREVKTPTVMYTRDGQALPYAEGNVIGIQYDPNRTARIALIQPSLLVAGSSIDLEPLSLCPHYQIASKDLRVGDTVTWMMNYDGTENALAEFSSRTSGSTVFLRDALVGQALYNIELDPMGGGKRVRASGTHATVQRKTDTEAILRLPSGEIRRFSLRCRASIGTVGGEDHALEVIGKAGNNRHRSKRPKVRGCAMNPIDHPHGGRTAGGRPTMTPWSRVQKGKPTKRNRSVFVVASRKAKGSAASNV